MVKVCLRLILNLIVWGRPVFPAANRFANEQ